MKYFEKIILFCIKHVYNGKVEAETKIEELFQNNLVRETYTKEEIQKFINKILEDSLVTRNGKDRGAVRRGLEALIKLLR